MILLILIPFGNRNTCGTIVLRKVGTTAALKDESKALLLKMLCKLGHYS